MIRVLILAMMFASVPFVALAHHHKAKPVDQRGGHFDENGRGFDRFGNWHKGRLGDKVY